MATLESSMEALCAHLRDRLAREVVTGRPDAKADGVYVWPWRLAEEPTFRSGPPGGHGEGATSPRPDQRIDLLVLVLPEAAQDSLRTLDAARDAILARPQLGLPDGSARLVLESPDPEALAGLFAASGIPLMACLSVTMRVTGGAQR